MLNRLLLTAVASCGLLSGLLRAEDAAQAIQPADPDLGREVDFNMDVFPMLQAKCLACHNRTTAESDLVLENVEAILKGGGSGESVVAGKPDESLLMQAVGYSGGLQMPPSGKLKSEQIAGLREWIRVGAPWPKQSANAPGDTGLVLKRLRYVPEEILFTKAGERSRVKVIAEWETGEREDVTCLARFQTNNDAIVTVEREGLATSVGDGDTHIVVFYDNGVAAIPVLKRYGSSSGVEHGNTAGQASSGTHPIDRFVNAKLGKLGLVPSETCSDAEFLRRVSIDMTGTLPTPDEVTTFLADNSDVKRDRQVDELLKRSTYAAWWANKLCDFTGCNPKSIASLQEVAREEGYVQASEWYDWIYERVQRNEPYDKLVQGIMLPDSFGLGNGMPTFWSRQSLKEPKDTAMSVAHAFLGIQLQCAECHKHPFDQWTQADFNDFSQFFDSVTRTKKRSAARDRKDLRLLRSQVVKLQAGDDPRQPIMEWMRDPQNPWFARAFVNRVWAGYFNVGIVDPPDQFTPANPPSNPQLLDWLTRGFLDSGYDMKWLHKQIATSDAYQRSWKPNNTNRNDGRNFSRAIPRRIPAEVVYDAMKQATAATDEQQDVRTNLRRRASGHLSMRMAGTHAMKVFGKPDRSINCDCERVNEPTLLQAIFSQNDPLVRLRIGDSGWIIEIEDAEADGTTPDPASLIDQLWLRTVARYPNTDEKNRAREQLASSQTTAEGIADLMWALLNTKEFLLNH